MATVAIIEPRSSGYGLIDKADDLGHRTVVLTANIDGRRVPEVHLRRARHIEFVDTNDDEAVIRVLQNLHEQQSAIDAVLPGFEHYVPLAARAASTLGLPGLDPSAALRMRYKHVMRDALAAAGVDQPGYAIVSADHQVVEAVSQIGLPCVVKPVDQSGSINVRKVTLLDEAQAAVHRARYGSDPELGRSSLSLALVEEFVAGPEYSVEGFVDNGNVYVLSLTKKLLASDSSFVEVGHIVPADLCPPQSDQIQRYVARVAQALGLTLGPFHAEVRLSSRGPLLMEIAARLAGDRIPHLLSLSHGIDLYDITLRCHLGLSISTPRVTPSRATVAGVRYFLRSGLSRYSHVSMADSLRGDPRIKEFTTLIRPGMNVPPAESSRARLGYAVVTDHNYSDVVTLLEELDRCTTFL